MVREGALTPRQDVQLLGALLQVHLKSQSVPAPDVDSGVPGQVGYEVSLAKLVDLLLNGNDLEGAQRLSGLKLLHVQCA